MARSADRSYEVLRAYSGSDGLNRLHSDRVDAIVLDLLMPEVDGNAFLERIRQEEDLRRIPVIIVTAKGYNLEDSRSLSGRMIAVAYRRGISNEESLIYLRGILEMLQSRELLVASSMT